MMSPTENVVVVKRVYDSFKAGDIATLLSLLSENVVWRIPTLENVPFSGLRRGRDQVGQFFAENAEAQESQQFAPQEFIAQGDKVVVLGSYQWRVKSTDRTYSADWAHVFTIQDGMVINFQEYTDTARAMAAYP
jgi:ketosteroid isomerase-like protein